VDPQLALGQFITLSGGAAFITAVVEVLKRTAAWSDATTQRFAPIASIVVGIALFLLVTAATVAVTGPVLASAGLAGVVAGMYACGIYNLGGKGVIERVAGPAAG
jgi:protein-S-isoprenylcysteine O-methyltransferase Ste14